MNIGDKCKTATGAVGKINKDCKCETSSNTPTYDCKDLKKNIGDKCVTASGATGVVDKDCKCQTRGK